MSPSNIAQQWAPRGSAQSRPGRHASPSRARSSALTIVLQVALVILVTAGALVSGFSFVDGDKTLAVLPVIAMVAVGLGLLALTPFSAFVILLLAVRPALDLLKLSSNATGTAVGNTASQRGLDPSSIVGVLFLLAAALWLAGRIRSGQLVPGSRLRTAMLAFLAACALSVVGSVQPQASALELLRIGTVVMMFVVLEQIITSRTVMIRVVVTCYVAMLIPLGFTLFGIVTGSPSSEVRGSFTRLTGPFNQSNTFARYLAFLLVFGIAIYPYVKPKLKLLFVAMLGLASVFMLLTLTRTAILGLGRRARRPGRGPEAQGPPRGSGRDRPVRPHGPARCGCPFRNSRRREHSCRDPDREHPGVAPALLDRGHSPGQRQSRDRYRARLDPVRDRRGQAAAQRLHPCLRGDGPRGPGLLRVHARRVGGQCAPRGATSAEGHAREWRCGRAHWLVRCVSCWEAWLPTSCPMW